MISRVLVIGLATLLAFGCKEDNEPAAAVDPLPEQPTRLEPLEEVPTEPTEPAAPLAPRAEAEVESDSSTRVLCRVGETKDGAQSGKGEITVDSPDVAGVSVRFKLHSEEKYWTLMSIECLSPGKAVIEFGEERIEVTVATALSEEAERSWEALVAQLDECKSVERMPDWANQFSAQVLVGADGTVGEVLTKGSVKEGVSQCVTTKIREWKAPASEDQFRLVELSWRDSKAVAKLPITDGDASRVEEGKHQFIRGNWKGVLDACEGVQTPQCDRLVGTAHLKLGNMKLACQHYENAGVNHPKCE